jgi:integrase
VIDPWRNVHHNEGSWGGSRLDVLFAPRWFSLRRSFPYGKQWTRTALQHRLEKLCAKLGITKGATLYSFRHGFASTMINDRRMNPTLVAIRLGHSDLKMLLKTYLHSDSEAIRKALDDAS